MKTMPMREFVARYDRRMPLIDVREPAEYAQGHVPGAVLIPLGQLAQRLVDVPKNDTVYVICGSGNRSQQGAMTLSGAGINAVSVEEGTSGWISRNGDLVSGLLPA